MPHRPQTPDPCLPPVVRASCRYDPEPSPNYTQGYTYIPPQTVEPFTGGDIVTPTLEYFGKNDLLSWMNKYWVSRGGNNYVFWLHEFAKHAVSRDVVFISGLLLLSDDDDASISTGVLTRKDLLLDVRPQMLRADLRARTRSRRLLPDGSRCKSIPTSNTYASPCITSEILTNRMTSSLLVTDICLWVSPAPRNTVRDQTPYLRMAS